MIERKGRSRNEELRLAYFLGFTDCLQRYAVWNNGEQYVGVMRKRLQDVIEETAKDLDVDIEDAFEFFIGIKRGNKQIREFQIGLNWL